MIQLDNTISPDLETLQKLSEYQAEINAIATFSERSEKAIAVFKVKNRKGNAVFDPVKEKLTAMCSGARRCVYCEDSVSDEVEHIHPKSLYPGLCFDWNNYVYACGTCNGPKNNKFAVFRADNNAFHIVNPLPKQPANEPLPGEPAMINPRIEDPMDYCMLDLISTFKFVFVNTLPPKEAQKAHYTFNEVLRLNEREYLRQARQTAYTMYKSRLGYYNQQKQDGCTQDKLDLLIASLKKEAHPTVWKEMQRQYKMGKMSKIDSELERLFNESPESLDW